MLKRKRFDLKLRILVVNAEICLAGRDDAQDAGQRENPDDGPPALAGRRSVRQHA